MLRYRRGRAGGRRTGEGGPWSLPPGLPHLLLNRCALLPPQPLEVPGRLAPGPEPILSERAAALLRAPLGHRAAAAQPARLPGPGVGSVLQAGAAAETERAAVPRCPGLSFHSPTARSASCGAEGLALRSWPGSGELMSTGCCR